MAAGFQTTHWSLIAKVKSDDSRESALAMETICRCYWVPLYVWLRSSGNSEFDSEDLTQGFFAYAIRKNIFSKVDPERGKLRSFLLVCLKRYLADERSKSNALKRSAQKDEVSLCRVNAELGEVLVERDLASPDATPAEIYEYRWARTLLDLAMKRLEEEHEARGKGELFSSLAPLLADNEPGSSIRVTAESLKCSEGTVRVAFHRFKQRFRELVREEVAKTLLPGEAVEEELNYLSEVLGLASRT